MRRLVLTLAALALLAPGVARAATVEVVTPAFGIAEVAYTAAPGEANRLVVSFDDLGKGATVTDPEAVITAGSHCTSIDAHTAHCDQPSYPPPYPDYFKVPIYAVDAQLGDRDDEVHPGTGVGFNQSIKADGGPGDDLLQGGDGGDQLDGGGGRDDLRGGDNGDLLVDGDASGSVDADHLDGGPGIFDEVDYSQRTGPVTVDLAAGTGGESGENDSLTGFENVVGGPGDDRLTGSSSFNNLTGNDGDDVIDGGDSTDVLRGGEGDDSISGGAGDDLIDGGDGLDSPACGEGRDSILAPDAGELLGRLCELVQIGEDEGNFVLAAQPVPISRRAVRMDLHCPGHGEFFSACGAVVKLRGVGQRERLLARGTFREDEDPEMLEPVRLRLTPLGRKLAAHRHGVIANVAYRTEAGFAIGWTIRLKTRQT